MNKPHEPNRLTDYLTEDQPEAELKQLREVHERATAEAQRQIQEASQREKQAEPKLETGKGRDRSPRGSTEPPKMRSESRVDPILPVLASVRQAPAREAGQLAFGGIVEGRELAGAQLPLLPAPEGPRVSLLEIADVRGGPIMARGRGAPPRSTPTRGSNHPDPAPCTASSGTAGGYRPGATGFLLPEWLGAPSALARDPPRPVEST